VLLAKKWGILKKKESESLIFTGLEIPRDYCILSNICKLEKYEIDRTNNTGGNNKYEN
jgi:hypothetical protein